MISTQPQRIIIWITPKSWFLIKQAPAYLFFVVEGPSILWWKCWKPLVSPDQLKRGESLCTSMGHHLLWIRRVQDRGKLHLVRKDLLTTGFNRYSVTVHEQIIINIYMHIYIESSENIRTRSFPKKALKECSASGFLSLLLSWFLIGWMCSIMYLYIYVAMDTKDTFLNKLIFLT